MLASAPSFPPSLEAYPAEQASLWATLADRVRVEPLNAVATAIFFAAIVHTFLAPKIAAIAHRYDHVRGGGTDRRSFRAELLHFLGEIEAIFGIWVVPLLAAIGWVKGWPAVESFMDHGVHFVEPVFVVVVMAIAGSRPVLQAAERAIGGVARLLGGGTGAWWLSILSFGPLLGSFITEPAAMVVCALLLARRFYGLGPSPALRYATLGLLFVNVSIGGTLTHFAAPPVLMVAGRWEWGLQHMLGHFGWKAALAIAVANGLYFAFFGRRIAALRQEQDAAAGERPPAPAWVVIAHLLFLAWSVFTAHTPSLFIGGFLIFVAFHQASRPHQEPLRLRSPLLVGFFLAGLVVHGALQGWWISPVLGRLGESSLFWGAMALTAFNDNAAITYLATLVPNLSEALRYAVVAGAVCGGGLTVIANAPNPAGQSILARYFGEDGVSPLKLLAAAAPATLVAAAAFLFL